MRVTYVLKGISLRGGIRIVLEHVSQLQAKGYDVWLYHLTGSVQAAKFSRPIKQVKSFLNEAALVKALTETRGVKIATWHETAPWVAASLQKGDVGGYLVQDIEDSYYRDEHKARKALATYALPLRLLATSQYVEHQLDLRFQRDSHWVSLGIDQSLFRLPEDGEPGGGREPDRISAQLRTYSGGVGAGGRYLKGWYVASRAIERVFSLNPQTTLSTFGPESSVRVHPELLHYHYCNARDFDIPNLYWDSSVFLSASNHEGFGLPIAEAMACGIPVVCTRAAGNEEFCKHGVTALMADPGDSEELSNHILHLQRNWQLGEQLSKAASEVVAAYTWERSLRLLEEAVPEMRNAR